MLKRTVLMATTALVLSFAATLPGLADPVTIRLVSKDLLTTNPDDVAELKAVEAAMKAKGTDINIQIVDLPSSGYADKLNAQILSGDIPDVIYFQGGDKQIADQGVLEDLGPWIAKSQYIKDALYPHNVQRLKNYPFLLYIFPPRIPQPVIRKDWLDKTGLKKPETVDDYVALFKAIRDDDLDGDGKKDTFGITTADNTDELDSIFDQAFGETASWLKDSSGQWINARVSDQEKAKIAFYASLREQGLYDPEYITTHWDVKEDKFYSGRAGVILGSSAEVIDIYGGKMAQAHPDQKPELVLLDPPKGPGGQGLKAVDVSKESRGFAISSQSQHKDEAFKLLDFMAGPDGQNIDRLGFEGQEYTKDGGTYKFTDKMATWYARFSQSANWTPPAQWMGQAAQDSLKNVTKYFKADNAFVWPADYASDLDATENVYRSWVYKFISGQAPMTDWDKYVAEFNGAGNTHMTDYARTTLNAAK